MVYLGNHPTNMCRAVPCIFAFLVLCFAYSIKPAAAFVVQTQPRSQLAASSNRRIRACNNNGNGGSPKQGGAKDNWRAKPAARRRRCRGGDGGGVQSLKAGLGFPPLGTEVVDFLARELQEQSVKHHWQSGFIGGSVGVVGTLTAIQLKINQVKELTACPYCRSSGQLPCATCFGVGSVSIADTVASSNEVTTTTLTCPCCRGKTFITCVNCKGDGRGVPLFLNKKVSRDPESEIEDVGYA